MNFLEASIYVFVELESKIMSLYFSSGDAISIAYIIACFTFPLHFYIFELGKLLGIKKVDVVWKVK